MKPYYPIPYSIDDTWVAIHVWYHLVVVYEIECDSGWVVPFAYQGKVGWNNGEIEVLEGDETAMPLDAIRTIFERSEE